MLGLPQGLRSARGESAGMQAASTFVQIKRPSRLRGLSGKLLVWTIIFVLLAEVLIFAPSIANMRLNWLKNTLSRAAAAGVVIDGLQSIDIPKDVQNDTLSATGTRAIVLKKDGTTRLLAVSDMPQALDGQYDVSDVDTLTAIKDAFHELFFGGDQIISVSGQLGEGGGMEVEAVLQDDALKRALLKYSARIAGFSLVISFITGALVFFTLNRMLIRPVRRITHNIQEFALDPEDPARILPVIDGRDELAFVAQHLSSMQTQLQRTLKQQRNLADLGLAVSKINHDMRNILASAQLMSDRLVDVDDPLVARLAPKLVRTIDRAVSYTTEVLSYGQTTEAAPRRRRFMLAELVQEVRDLMPHDADIEFVQSVPADLEMDADSEQMFRVIHNLCRNARQALSGFLTDQPDGRGRITISAQRFGASVAVIVDDNGPGMPQKARENLFSAFKGSARSGGTGLGLVIAREIVLAHGGTIALVEKPGPGTQFRIEIPDREEAQADFRLRVVK